MERGEAGSRKAPARVYNSTDMEAPRRRWIPVTFLIWLGLFVLAAELNSDRPNMGDPRWSRQWYASYPDGEGMFYAWVLPALGIVWTLALLLRVPRDERIGRRRMFWAWMKAGLGMGIVLGTVGTYVSDFKAADVGSLNEIATWMSLAFFLAIVSVALVKLRARWPAMTVRAAGLIGSAAALAIGLWFYWVDLPDDGVRGLKGSARAEALFASLNYNGSNEACAPRRKSTAQPAWATRCSRREIALTSKSQCHGRKPMPSDANGSPSSGIIPAPCWPTFQSHRGMPIGALRPTIRRRWCSRSDSPPISGRFTRS